MTIIIYHLTETKIERIFNMEGFAILVIVLVFTTAEAAWGKDDGKRVKLRDVDVLTLYYGKMTKGRRSSPLPQLECVNGGTAPCSAFRPKVVQCINKGSDGSNVQWECKTDMDNAFRFGELEVSCEGYDYPDDPYILHDSCGLKYSLDYTKEGLDRKKHHDYYGNDAYSSNHHESYTSTKSKSTTSSIIADLIVYIGMGLIVFALYKTCTNSGRREGQTAYSSTNDDYPSSGGGGGGGGYGWFGGGQAPPPSYSDSYDGNASCRNRNAGYGGTGAGGFWTGAATGGLLGYMFGNRQNAWGGGWGGNRGWGGGGYSGGTFRGSSSSSSSSSGTRTASGFGETSRR